MSSASLPTFADLARLSEDERIEMIARCAADRHLVVAVALEDDDEKILRYQQKLEHARPGRLAIEQRQGLVANTVILRVRPRSHPAALEAN